MKKQFGQIAVLMLMLAFVLCACGTASEHEDKETIVPTETIAETTEPEMEPDPEWLSDTAIDEAYAYLFPLNGEKDVELAQEILLPLVEAGNAEAQYYWGYIYDWEIVDNNGDEEKESLLWYTLAAEQGFPKAYLAASLNTYIESEERADELVELATQAGVFEMTPEELGADGCEMIASYYYGKKDYKHALEWYTKAAEMGCSVSMYFIGAMYYDGTGVKEDIDIALDWLLKAANLGNVYAMNYYGYIFFENNYEEELVKKKYAAAAENYRESAESGDPVAMHNLGQLYDWGMGGVNYNAKAASEWYLKAANLGDAYSMYRVGTMYQYGYGTVVNQDYDTALEWYSKAAELKNPDAMEALGMMYSQGLGVEKDDEEAQKLWQEAWEIRQASETNDEYIDVGSDRMAFRDVALELLQKAADAGERSAMNNLGYWGYEKGYKYLDERESRIWYKKASDEGEPTAMANLGFSYYRSGNYDSAMEWLIKAHVNGVDYVADDINNMLTKKQGVNAYFENYGELISVKP